MKTGASRCTLFAGNLLRRTFFSLWLGLWGISGLGASSGDLPQDPPDKSFEELSQDSETCKEAFEHALVSLKKAREPLLPEAAQCPVEHKLIAWLWLQDFGEDVESMWRFLEKNPHWPQLGKIRGQIEKRLPSSLSPRRIVLYFKAYPPLSSAGACRYAEALSKVEKQARVAESVRHLWRTVDFTESDEKRFYALYKRFITPDDTHRRLNKLVMEGNERGLKSLESKVSKNAQQAISHALKLIQKKGRLSLAFTRLPESYTLFPGMAYQRLQWHLKRKEYKEAQELFEKAARKSVFKDYPEVFLKFRNLFARHLFGEKDIKGAQKFYTQNPLFREKPKGGKAVAEIHREEKALARWLVAAGLSPREALRIYGAFVEGWWFQGWIALVYLNHPHESRNIFSHLYNCVQSCVSKAKMAYWTGRSLQALGRSSEAKQWFEKASQYPSTYYGQLSLKALEKPLKLQLCGSLPPVLSKEEQDLWQAVRLLNRDFLKNAQENFLLFLAARVGRDSPYNGPALAELAHEVGLPYLAVEVARNAGFKKSILTECAFPMVELPAEYLSLPHLDSAFVHALVRQESNFNAKAKSCVGASGLMQLMPTTWQMWLKKLGSKIKWDSGADPFNPQHNLILGMNHLSWEMSKFQGNRALALAAYNAGARPVYEWIEKFGDPRDPSVDLINWIEAIPYEQTRGYIQRISETIPFYENRSYKPPGAQASNLNKDRD